MPFLIRPNETKFVTKEGECAIHITFDPIVLELNVNLNSDGLSISKGTQPDKQEDDAERPAWVPPNFSSKNRKIKFGETVEEE